MTHYHIFCMDSSRDRVSGGVRGVRFSGEGSLARFVIRLASLNVGTLNGKFLELVDVLRKRKVDMACIQETR